MFPIVASILEVKKRDAELACGSNRNWKRFGLLFEEAFVEPYRGEVRRQMEVEQ